MLGAWLSVLPPDDGVFRFLVGVCFFNGLFVLSSRLLLRNEAAGLRAVLGLGFLREFLALLMLVFARVLGPGLVALRDLSIVAEKRSSSVS